MNYKNIPPELQAWPNWVVWRAETIADTGKVAKRPYNVRTHRYADITNKEHWATFDECLLTLENSTYYNGLGFCLSLEAGYTAVDIDQTNVQQDLDRQLLVYQQLDSYSERSPSGFGAHIMVKALTPIGVRSGPIEIYGCNRYITFTGNIINDKPIEDRTELIDKYVSEIQSMRKAHSGGKAIVYSGPETQSDKDVYNVACAAANGDKFVNLYAGEWQIYSPHPYGSQSEADFALVDILAYYTDNLEQVRRMFRASGLFREKANREDYMQRMLSRAFDRKLQPVDISALEAEFAKRANEGVQSKNTPSPVNAIGSVDTWQKQHGTADLTAANQRKGLKADAGIMLARTHKDVQVVGNDKEPIFESDEEYNEGMEVVEPEGMVVVEPEGLAVFNPNNYLDHPLKHFPEGLLGEIAQWIFDQAERPVREIALAGAIAMMSGICGRAYNISNTGLNQYIFLLAKTGSGKEAIASGIVKLFQHCQTYMSASTSDVKMQALRYYGPSDLKSEAALVNTLLEQTCCVSIIGEFGVKLRQMTNDRASPADIGLKRALLDIYNKSGFNDMLGSVAYADKDKTTKRIKSPSYTLVGESEPTSFYGHLDSTQISSGLLPRFFMIEYTGPRVASNPNKISFPNSNLVRKVCDVIANCNSLDRSENVCNVEFSRDAYEVFRSFNLHADLQINSSKVDVVHQLWNRAHLKSLKLAAVTAIGVNPFKPTINEAQAKWATSCIANEIRNLVVKFDVGEIGELIVGKPVDEILQINCLKKVISRMLVREFVSNTDSQTREMYQASIMPYSLIQNRCSNLVPFKNDRQGATVALQRAITHCVDDGLIAEVPKGQMHMKFGKSIKAYAIINRRHFE